MGYAHVWQVGYMAVGQTGGRQAGGEWRRYKAGRQEGGRCVLM